MMWCDFDLSSISMVFLIPILDVCGAVTGLTGTDVILECVFNRTDTWIFVRWTRIDLTTREHSALMTLSPWTEGAIYSQRLPPTLSKRLHPQIEKKGLVHTFYLLISDVECTDTAEYVCDVNTPDETISMVTTLTVETLPEQPHINYHTLVIRENETGVLRCGGKVGYPPGRLEWFYRSPDSDYFHRVANQPTSALKSMSACSARGITNLNVTGSAGNNGGLYRCFVSSPHTSPANSKFYDEVEIKLPENPPTDGSTRADGYLIYQISETYDNSSSRIHTKLTILTVVVALFHMIAR